jgi:hypothetical protein
VSQQSQWQLLDLMPHMAVQQRQHRSCCAPVTTQRLLMRVTLNSLRLQCCGTRGWHCGWIFVHCGACVLLMLRAAGYDARHVCDNADHVWNEYWSRPLGRWVHVDSCETAWDTPLLYEGGWGKTLGLVLAASWHGHADVTRCACCITVLQPTTGKVTPTHPHHKAYRQCTSRVWPVSDQQIIKFIYFHCACT